MVFCPIFARWISSVRCLEITLGRTLYDDIERDEWSEIKRPSQTIREAVLSSDRVFPEDVAEVITICKFCEEHCLGKPDGPNNIPPRHLLMKDR